MFAQDYSFLKKGKEIVKSNKHPFRRFFIIKFTKLIKKHLKND